VRRGHDSFLSRLFSNIPVHTPSFHTVKSLFDRAAWMWFERWLFSPPTVSFLEDFSTTCRIALLGKLATLFLRGEAE